MYTDALLERLLQTQHDGAWGYAPAQAPAAEPVSWASIALHARGAGPERLRSALQWLGAIQRPDGAVPVTSDAAAPCWATGPAVLAWRLAGDDDAAHSEHVRRAVDWLLGSRGRLLPYNPTVFGHDTSLTGWSWVDGTHSWVEPTAYSIMALRAAGHNAHARVREGVRLLLDRSFPTGGWNYGNTRVYQNTLRPFPGPSGVALTALAGEPLDSRIEAGIDYLTRELAGIRAPMSLAWGLLGLSAWDRRPTDAEEWLAQTAARCARAAPNALHDALLLLAASHECPLIARPTPEVTHG